jgi:hypothetical protein
VSDPNVEQVIYAAALVEAADEVHIEARWQEEQRRRFQRDPARVAAAHEEAIKSLLKVERILRDKARRLGRDSV